MGDQPAWVRRFVLPIAATAVATAITLSLWSSVKPSVSPMFFLAVMVSSVYGGITAGLVATALSAITIAYLFMPPEFSFTIGSADVVRLVVFGAVALLTNSIAAERNRTQAEQQRLVEEVRLVNARIRTLSDLLPMCPDCKRVQVASEWKSIERYLAETPELQISHALCPDCSAHHFPEFHAAVK